jgi:hypothetical protein
MVWRSVLWFSSPEKKTLGVALSRARACFVSVAPQSPSPSYRKSRSRVFGVIAIQRYDRDHAAPRLRSLRILMRLAAEVLRPRVFSVRATLFSPSHPQ